MIADLTAKARKFAGILVVPAWRRALLRYRVAAGVEHARVLCNLGPVATVVDIGANRGQFALCRAACFSPGAHRFVRAAGRAGGAVSGGVCGR